MNERKRGDVVELIDTRYGMEITETRLDFSTWIKSRINDNDVFINKRLET